MAAITKTTKASVTLNGSTLPLTVHVKTHAYDSETKTKTPLATPSYSLVWSPDPDATGSAFSGVEVPWQGKGLEDLPREATVKVGRETVKVTLTPGTFGKASANPLSMLQGYGSLDGVRAMVRLVRVDGDTVRVTVTVTKGGGGPRRQVVKANPFG